MQRGQKYHDRRECQIFIQSLCFLCISNTPLESYNNVNCSIIGSGGSVEVYVGVSLLNGFEGVSRESVGVFSGLLGFRAFGLVF